MPLKCLISHKMLHFTNNGAVEDFRFRIPAVVTVEFFKSLALKRTENLWILLDVKCNSKMQCPCKSSILEWFGYSKKITETDCICL